MKIDGKEIGQAILDNLKKRTEKLKKKNIYPKLAIIQVGSDPASASYVRQKELKAKEIGIETIILHLSDKTPQISLIKTIRQFNNDNNIYGIIVQQPLPSQINPKNIIEAIDPRKDVDGFHPNSHFQMPIAMAVLEILKEIYLKKSEARNPKSETNSNNQNLNDRNFSNLENSNFEIVSSFDIRYSNFISWLKSKKIAIIGKGETGGKPVMTMFEKMKIPYTVIDSKTKNPQGLTKKADILISAVGKINVVKPPMLKKGAVLIGIGISRGESAKLMGDYDQNKIKNIASFYTPTPGGVGPINVAMLLKNLIIATEKLI